MCRHQGHHHHHNGQQGHHEHEHGHDHHQGHDHSPVPTAEEAPIPALTPHQRLTRMVEHWLHHNEEHAHSFRDWAERAREMGQMGAAVLIEDVARQSLLQNEQLQKALALLRSASGQSS
jgi:hypothetical protein